MAYGIKYVGQFDSFKQDPAMYFEVQILEKNFTGDPVKIILSGTPVIHEWQDDERNKPIKGSTLKVGIINNGIVSMESFFSNDDFQYQIILRQRSTDEILFIGYIIQDECSEVMCDFNHEINITATDMLGTLKDISILDAAMNHGTITSFPGITFNALDSISLTTSDVRVANLLPGQTIYIDNGLYQGEYVILDLTFNILFGYRLLFGVTSFTPFTSDTCDCRWRVPTDLTVYRSLSELLRLCIQSTNLELGTKVISKIYPIGSDVERWLDGTYVLPTSFMKSGSWMNCYDVMEAILDRFRATLFQSKGFWWIIRFDEIYNGITVPYYTNYLGYLYDSEFVYDSDIDTNDYFISLNFNNFEFGNIKSIERAIGYTKDTFQYEQPDDLLKNANLTILGALLNTTSTGSGSTLVTTYEYQNDFWYPWDDHPTPTPDVRIRIKKDYLGNEIERYLIIDGTAYTDYRAKMSNDIQLQKGDIITWSFQFRTEVSEPGPVNTLFSVRIKNCVDPELWMDQDGLFGTSNIQFSILTGDNLNEWHDVTVTSVALPMNSIMNIFLNIPNGDKTYYKDLRLEIRRAQNNLGLVNGHTHQYDNTTIINNTLEKEIKIDNSPSASIAGTLFLDNYTGCIRNLATQWASPWDGTDFNNLGRLVLAEELLIRYKSRYKYDGNLLNVFRPFPSNYIIGPETAVLFNNDINDPIRYTFGRLSIDYKNGNADVTMNYIGDDNEVISTIVDNYIYTFNYLYENN